MPSKGSLTLRQVEAEVFKETRSLYVFDDTPMVTTYIVIEVRGCEKGQPLLPNVDGDGTLQGWSPPEDRYQHFANYLVTESGCRLSAVGS